MIDYEKGLEDVARTIHASHRPLDQVNDNYAYRFVRELGWNGFAWIIRQRLDTIYPAPYFRTEAYITWRAEMDYGPGADPGIKWATLLDLAMKELEG